MRTYKKISNKHLPFIGLVDVYFGGELIGLIDVTQKLNLTVTSNWQDYTSDSTGGNVLESKMTAIDIRGAMQLVFNKNTVYDYTNIFKSDTDTDGFNINLSQSLGTSSKKGSLKLVRREDNKTIFFNNSILKGNIPINLNTDGLSLVNVEFIVIPEKVNNEYVLGEIEGNLLFALSDLETESQFGNDGLDKGVFKE